MPIKGWSDSKRLPRIGKIHLGERKTSEKTQKEYPTQTDYFVVKPDDSTGIPAAQAFYDVYGPTPREITIAFPSNDPDSFFPQSLSSYRKIGERHKLYCRGDGESASRSDGEGGRFQMECRYQECPVYQDDKCKELSQLQFFLPDVPGLGLWQIDSSSYNTTRNLNGSIEMIRALTGGRIAMIPLKLRIIPKVVDPDGKPKTVYVLTLGVDDMRLTDFMQNTPLLTANTPIIEPIPEDELPDDLYVNSAIIDGATSTTSGPQDTSPIESGDAGEIGAVIDVEFKEYHGSQDGACRLRVASRQGDIVELLTTQPNLLKELHELTEGATILFSSQPSKLFQNRMELANIRQVS